jgi:hypothetical protein
LFRVIRGFARPAFLIRVNRYTSSIAFGGRIRQWRMFSAGRARRAPDKEETFEKPERPVRFPLKNLFQNFSFITMFLRLDEEFRKNSIFPATSIILKKQN